VDRVVCAVDCGTPRSLRRWKAASASAWAPRSTTRSRSGTAKYEQTNFDGYQVLRIDEMPKVEVHVVQSPEAPTGVGEPGVAPVGPAVANAVFAATGKRLRVLPFAVGGTA
jgi:isoquinoline 1-oxidoreductase beta subunit